MLSFRALLLVIFLPAIGCEFEPGPGNNVTPKEDPEPIQKPSSRDGSVAAPSDSGINNPLQDSGSDGPFGRKDAGPFVLDGGSYLRDSGGPYPQVDAGRLAIDGGIHIPTLDAGHSLDEDGGATAESDSGVDGGSGTLIVDPACLQTQFRDRLAGVLRRTCSLCHTVDGMASNSSFLLTPLYADQESLVDEANFHIFKNFLSADPIHASWVWQKPTHTIAHGGGQVLDEESEAVLALMEFAAMVDGALVCEASTLPLMTEEEWILATPKDTLRGAALLLTDTLPTSNEADALTDDLDSLDPALERLFTKPSFAERIGQIYEDALLTNTWRSRNNAYWLMRAWGLGPDSQGNTRGNYQWMMEYAHPSIPEENEHWSNLLQSTAYGFSRSAKELVKYVVATDRDFGEVLTARYTMVNPYSARTYGLDEEVEGIMNVAEDETADRYLFVPVEIPDVPTSGILTDINFLGTWPTGPVNLNRSRAREILKTFLATDVLSLRNRSSEDFGSNELNPTYNNLVCASCHTVMDPIAGAFQNWPKIQYQGIYDPLHQDAQARWADTNPETLLREPGLTTTHPLPLDRMNDSLRWLAAQIVEDPRFAKATVRVVFEGLSGRAPMDEPLLKDENYLHKLRAWQFQRVLFEKIEREFTENGRSMRALIKALVKSPLIRAIQFSGTSEIPSAHFGIHRLVTPEDLERKLIATTGRKWSTYVMRIHPDDESPNYHWRFDIDQEHRSFLVEFRESCGNGGNGCYARWYGMLGGQNAIPTGGNPNRLLAENGLLQGVLERMSGEMAWRVVPRDFAIINALPPEDQANSPPFEDRLFFPFVDMDTLPFDEVGNPLPDAQDAIRTNLVYLNKRLLGLTYSENHPEIDMAYELFVSALALQTPGVGAGSSASVEQGEINAKSAWELAQGLTPPARRVVTHDTYGTLGAWKVIIDYLLSDYFFLHQALPEPGGVP